MTRDDQVRKTKTKIEIELTGEQVRALEEMLRMAQVDERNYEDMVRASKLVEEISDTYDYYFSNGLIRPDFDEEEED
jgi:hypothetical protein